MADPNREDRFDATLRDALHPKSTEPGRHCAPPDILAAYYEGRLGPEDVSLCEAHFAECTACRQHLAGLWRTEAPAAGTTEPEPPRDRAPRSPRLSRLVLPATLAAAAVTAVAVGWNLLPEETQRPDLSGAEMARAPGGTPAEPDQSATRGPEETRRPSDERRRDGPARRDAPAAAPSGTDALADLKEETTVPPAPTSAPEPTAPPSPAPAATAPPAPTPEPTAPPEPTAVPTARPTDVPQSDETDRTVGAARLSEPREATAMAEAPRREETPAARQGATSPRKAVPEPTSGPGTKTGTETAASRTQRTVLILTPERDVLWKVVARDRILRSTNGGRSWKVQSANVDAELLSGSAPSTSACWIVGRRGTILQTATGGETWTTISPPARFDFVRVQARSSQEATIVTGSGRRYTTQDGGNTWR